MADNFLVTSRADMKRRGWEQLDFVYINGDAYVDHPGFAAAVIGGKAGDIASALAHSLIGIVRSPLKPWANRDWPR